MLKAGVWPLLNRKSQCKPYDPPPPKHRRCILRLSWEDSTCSVTWLRSQYLPSSYLTPFVRYGQYVHERFDNLLFERLDSFLLWHTGLRHHQFNVLGFDPGFIHFLPIVIIVIVSFLSVAGINSFAFAMVVRVIVSRVGIVSGVDVFGSGKLRGSVGLSLRVEVLDLGFTKDTRCKLSKLFVFWAEERWRTYIQVLLVGDL